MKQIEFCLHDTIDIARQNLFQRILNSKVHYPHIKILKLADGNKWKKVSSDPEQSNDFELHLFHQLDSLRLILPTIIQTEFNPNPILNLIWIIISRRKLSFHHQPILIRLRWLNLWGRQNTLKVMLRSIFQFQTLEKYHW